MMTLLRRKLRKFVPSFFLKEPTPRPEYAFYQTYKSIADPVYHPNLDNTEMGADIRKVKQDIETEMYHDPYARSILYSFAKQSLLAKGDFIECGVHHGGGSHTMAFVLDRFAKTRIMWCFDSFQGFSKPCEKDLEVTSNKQFFREFDLNNTSVELVKKTLNQHQCPIKIVQGWIPNTFDAIKDRTFCCAHIDVDLYDPILESVKFLYPRMSKGGIMIFDDYGFPMCPGARQAVDEYFQDKKETVIAFPTGQSIVIKS
ncbi:MAG TPA: TylF/MycF/NovP-related O-methyltransferase [Chlamydiales bacterium]|nr:TylF/MycF/NovP-related O-methyltransferase [Chlamydiales bacterium]